MYFKFMAPSDKFDRKFRSYINAKIITEFTFQKSKLSRCNEPDKCSKSKVKISSGVRPTLQGWLHAKVVEASVQVTDWLKLRSGH